MRFEVESGAMRYVCDRCHAEFDEPRAADAHEEGCMKTAGPSDQQLDASCFDDERHEAVYGYPLNAPSEPRDEDDNEHGGEG